LFANGYVREKLNVKTDVDFISVEFSNVDATSDCLRFWTLFCSDL